MISLKNSIGGKATQHSRKVAHPCAEFCLREKSNSPPHEELGNALVVSEAVEEPTHGALSNPPYRKRVDDGPKDPKRQRDEPKLLGVYHPHYPRRYRTHSLHRNLRNFAPPWSQNPKNFEFSKSFGFRLNMKK